MDLWTRLWCVCELFFAEQRTVFEGEILVVGSDKFSGNTSSCLDAECRAVADKVRILHELTGGAVANPALVERIDAVIRDFRAHTPDPSVRATGVYAYTPATRPDPNVYNSYRELATHTCDAAGYLSVDVEAVFSI